MKIVIGLSGGVDSSVAAHLLLEEGHELIGCMMRTFDTPESEREAEDAARVAERLQIPFYRVDYREAFRKEIISYFIYEYTHGRTPNPCCICNRRVKWEALLSCAEAHGADMVATGHYARVAQLCGGRLPAADRTAGKRGAAPYGEAFCGNSKETAPRYCIRQAKTVRKDQSYALYNLTQEQLARTLMPLGGYEKNEVREIAAKIGLFTSGKPDSQEICFIPDKDYAGFIERQLRASGTCGADVPAYDAARAGREACLGAALSGQPIAWNEPGSFVDVYGNVLGRHEGIVHYTVGQRKGLKLALGKRVFVKEIRPLTNEVVLADNDEVFSGRLCMRAVNWQGTDFEVLSRNNPQAVLSARVKIRYAHEGTWAEVRRMSEQAKDKAGDVRYEVRFSEPVRAVTPGQAAVLYDENGCILGGGLIEHESEAAESRSGLKQV